MNSYQETMFCAAPPNQSGVYLAGAFILSLVLIVLLTFVPLSTNDFWMQVAVGKMIWDTRSIPDTVIFAFTEAKHFPFHAHEWLPSVGFYLLHSNFGYQNLIWVKGALGLLIAALVYLLSYQINRNHPSSLFLTLAVMVTANFRHFMRPEIFGYIAVLVELNLLTHYNNSKQQRALLALIPLTLIWANSHGSFLVGLIIVAIFGAGEMMEALIRGWKERRIIDFRRAIIVALPLFFAFLAMLLTSLCNPNGLALFFFSWDFAQWEFTKSTFYEWVPTFSSEFYGTRAFWAFIGYSVILLGALFKGRKNLNLTSLLLLIAFCTLALDRQRHIALYAYVTTYVFAHALRGPCHLRLVERTRTLGVALFAALGIGLVQQYGNLYGAFPNRIFSWNLSPQAIAYIDSNRLSGNVFNSLGLGAELVQKFYPQLEITIDSRIDAYGESYFARYNEWMRDEDALLKFIDQYRVSLIIVTFMDYQATIQKMDRLATNGWWPIFHDDKIVILGSRPVAEKLRG